MTIASWNAVDRPSLSLAMRANWVGDSGADTDSAFCGTAVGANSNANVISKDFCEADVIEMELSQKNEREGEMEAAYSCRVENLQ